MATIPKNERVNALEKSRKNLEKSSQKDEIKRLQNQNKIKELKAKRFERLKKSQGANFKQISKAYGYKTKLSNYLLSIGAGQGQSSSQGGVRAVGRPKGSLKWRSPFNNQPITAPEYYKQVRALRRIQAQKAESIQQVQQANMARQGITPQQMEQIRQQQVMQQQSNQQQSQQQQINQMANAQQQRIFPGRRGFQDYDWGLFGRKIVTRGLPESMWN